MNIEDRIKRWREEKPGKESEGPIDLLCDAEEELRRLRAPTTDITAPFAVRAPDYTDGWMAGFRRALQMLSDGGTVTGLRAWIDGDPQVPSDPRPRLDGIEKALEPLRDEIVEAAWCDAQWEAVAEAVWPGSSDEQATKEKAPA